MSDCTVIFFSEPETVPGGRNYGAYGRQGDRFEMTDVNTDTVPLTAGVDETTAFFSEVNFSFWFMCISHDSVNPLLNRSVLSKTA